MENETVKELVIRLQHGDEAAFNEIYERYHRFALKMGYELTGSYDAAQDIAQESFFQVNKYIHTLRCPELFSSWFKRILISKGVRYQQKNKAILLKDTYASLLEQVPEDSSIKLPSKFTNNEIQKEIMQSFIAELPKPQKDVILCVYYQQLSMAETAKELDVPENTVKSRLRRAKDVLREKVEEYEHREQIKIGFDVDLLFPLAASGIGITLSGAFMNFSKYFSTQSAGSLIIGTAVVTTLAVSTTQLIKQEEATTKLRNEAQNVQETQTTVTPEEFVAQEHTPAEDYFYLRSFGYDEYYLKDKTEEELQSIQPIVKRLEASGSPYYDTLKNEGWIDFVTR